MQKVQTPQPKVLQPIVQAGPKQLGEDVPSSSELELLYVDDTERLCRDHEKIIE